MIDEPAMRFNQVNISNNDYDNRLTSHTSKINSERLRGSFSFKPIQKEICPLSNIELVNIDQNLDFILSHFQTPMFPRNIMTKALGHQ